MAARPSRGQPPLRRSPERCPSRAAAGGRTTRRSRPARPGTARPRRSTDPGNAQRAVRHGASGRAAHRRRRARRPRPPGDQRAPQAAYPQRLGGAARGRTRTGRVERPVRRRRRPPRQAEAGIPARPAGATPTTSCATPRCSCAWWSGCWSSSPRCPSRASPAVDEELAASRGGEGTGAATSAPSAPARPPPRRRAPRGEYGSPRSQQAHRRPRAGDPSLRRARHGARRNRVVDARHCAAEEPPAVSDPLRPRASLRTAVVWEVLKDALERRVKAAGRDALDVLDTGGGTGNFAVPVARLGHRVTVVDPSPNALFALERRAAEAGRRRPGTRRPGRRPRPLRRRRARRLRRRALPRRPGVRRRPGRGRPQRRRRRCARPAPSACSPPVWAAPSSRAPSRATSPRPATPSPTRPAAGARATRCRAASPPTSSPSWCPPPA